MLKWLGKVFAEKIVALLALLLVVALIVLLWLNYHALPTLGEVGLFFAALAMWFVVASVLPWATFFLVGWANKAQNNVPAILVLLFWASIDALLALWLVRGWPAVGQWIVVVVAFLLGGLYNLIAANQIASRLQR